MCETGTVGYSIKAEVFDADHNKAVLNAGGPMTMSYLKAEHFVKGMKKEELFDLLIRQIGFEELEGALSREPDNYLLNTMMHYLDEVEVIADDPVMSGLYRIQRNVRKFHDELLNLGEIVLVKIHQLHVGGSEECDFMDYLDIPWEDDEELMRQYLQENLSADSDIEKIMDHFEDGEFYIRSYEADRLLTIDLVSGRAEEKSTVNEIY